MKMCNLKEKIQTFSLRGLCTPPTAIQETVDSPWTVIIIHPCSDFGALVVTLRTCYGALQIVVLLLYASMWQIVLVAKLPQHGPEV